MQKENRFTLIEHLEELRYRIIVCLVTIAFFSIFSYCYAKEILNILTRPVEKLVFIFPLELFLVYLKIALVTGLLLSSPVIFYQLWSFVKSGLYPQERKYVQIFFPFSILLFIGGVLFSYFIIFPFGIKFLLCFATDKITPMLSVSRYLSFLLILLFATGIVFQTPVVVLFLTKIGLVNFRILRRNRKYVVVLAFVIAAIITPTVDVFTQCLLALPIILLYEISIWFSKLFGNKNISH